MNLLDIINNNMEYILIGIIGVLVIFLIVLIVFGVKLRKMKKKYKSFMTGKDAKSLEDTVLEKLDEIKIIKEDIDVTTKNIKEIKENLLITYQKIGIVKYDAFKEMGGKLSFALSMLNDKNDGFIINSMHSSREGCYTYVKEIINGESFVVLAEEEKKALEIALKTKNYIE